MDAAQALVELTEISPQIEVAVIFDEGGAVEGSTLQDAEHSRELARLGAQLVDEASRVRSAEAGDVLQLQAQLNAGSVFLLRDGERRIVATTGQEPTVGLVFYDLRSGLRSLREEAGAS